MSSDKPDRTDKRTQVADINTAAALRAQYAIEVPKSNRRRRHKRDDHTEGDIPLVDMTANLQLHSKKTERLNRRQTRKFEKVANQIAASSLLLLPADLILEIAMFLQPSDVLHMQQTSRNIRELLMRHEDLIARELIRWRYWTLYRSLQLPFALVDVPEDAHQALLSEKRQEMLNIHRKPYHQHIQTFDPHFICTCMTCVFAWNNLCLVLDLNHWQYNLEQRQPIPMIPRGTNPEWNQVLLERHGSIVRMAMARPLVYAFILEKHLATVTGTIARTARWKLKGQKNSKPRLYQLTDDDIHLGTDEFLERYGPPSYDFPFHRDNYYLLEAYLPNRKWSPEAKKWHYYPLPPAQHQRDVEWVKSWLHRSQPNGA